MLRTKAAAAGLVPHRKLIPAAAQLWKPRAVWNIPALSPTAGPPNHTSATQVRLQSSTANYPSNKGSQWTQMCSTFLLEGAEEHPSHCSPTVPPCSCFPPFLRSVHTIGNPSTAFPFFFFKGLKTPFPVDVAMISLRAVVLWLTAKETNIAPGLEAQLGSKTNNREHLQSNTCLQNIGQGFWALQVLAT